MKKKNKSKIPLILQKYHKALIEDWIKEQLASTTLRPDLMSKTDLRQQSAKFLAVLREATQDGDLNDITSPAWASVREALKDISHSRAERGYTSTETAIFVFSIKRPLFSFLRREVKGEDSLADEMWLATALIDKLGLYTVEAYQSMREKVILRQQSEIAELSTPVVEFWDGVLGVPLIGTLDSARTQVVTEGLLQKIADTGSEIAIIDITGVPMVDTQVAQHLLKTVTAARLMGADCIISGIRPQIAQTIVSLGVKFDLMTKASLADAIQAAFQKLGLRVTGGGARP
ncbi:MAG: STAS domain-containing protein [Candidatus Abyssobacteria bacterium SURF_17]|jgi:rsbT co-antagonist protein RsbR|uniref:STAS domain-containing protein n=1 Tax=Candidatus Abyssobacteria bacterium SURF_17 TaxID=2093361 RepID=A0A419F4B7_9BACT|nr:MAG: STAS domain-containing protein [Candidatus Abyssubacteria bacterium SURF_17]